MKFSAPAPPYQVFSTKPCDYDEYRQPAQQFSYPRYPQVQSPLMSISETSPLAYDLRLRRRRSSECDCDLRAALANQATFSPPQPTFHPLRQGSISPPPAVKLIRLVPKRIKRNKEVDGIKKRRWDTNPSSIDKYSRVIFPLAFATFNAIYWLVYIHISQKEL